MTPLSSHVETALRSSHQGFRALVEANIVGVALGGEDIITDANDKFLAMIGYSQDDLKAGLVKWRAMAAPESAEEDLRAYNEMKAQGACHPFEKAYIRKDGTLIHTLVGAAITRSEPLEWLSFVIDLSERKRYESQISQLYEREHRIAESLQAALLTQPSRHSYTGLEVETVYRAAWEEADIGGDYYDVFFLGAGKVALIIGDVSGKGLVAATRTAEIKFTLRAYLMQHKEPATALSLLNKFLCHAHEIEGDGRQFFVVMAVALLDQGTGSVDFACGGAEPPFIIRASGAAEEIEARGLPLGIASDAEYSTVTMDMAMGDLLIMATDGLTESRSGQSFLGMSGLVALAQQAASAGEINKIGKAILDGTDTFAAGKRHDDICLVLARRTATDSRV